MEKNQKYQLNEQNGNNKNWWQSSLVLFYRFSGWILAPIIIGLILGKWLDAKYKTEPWFFLAMTGISFCVSTFGLIKEANIEYKKLIHKQKDDKKTNNK